MAVLDEIDAARPLKEPGTYHFIWRWHFYAGLIVAPFLIILAISGSLILFDREIESVVYRDLVQVAPAAKSIPVSEQEAIVLAAYPGAKVQRFVYPLKEDHAAEWMIAAKDGRALTVFVNPGTGAITGAMNSESRFSRIVTGLHGNLLMGKGGSFAVEFAGCWGFVLLLSGLFLWWPRKARNVGVAVPRMSAKGRSLWRDLHAVPSMWNAGIIAFLIMSGLPWSAFWGGQLAKLGTVSSITAPSPNFISPPSAPSAAAPRKAVHDHDMSAHDLPWSIKSAGLPMSAANGQGIGIGFMMNEAAARGIATSGLRVLYPQNSGDVFTLSFVPATAQGQRTVHFDPADGALIEDIGWEQYSPLGKAVEFGVETHVGKQFGLPNQLVLLASCLLLVATISFGILMWWRRRPSGRLGVPPVPKGFRPNVALFIVIAICAVIFPLVGASMFVIWLFDRAFAAKPE